MTLGERRIRTRRRAVSQRPSDEAVAAGMRRAGAALIPYDYAATFVLKGEPGRVHEDVIKISSESVFVAYAVSYGLEEERGRELIPALTSAQENAVFQAGDLTLGQVPAAALVDGFRFSPRERAATGAGSTPEVPFFDREFTDASKHRIFERLKRPEEVSFLFSLIDTASGRELQDEPANNLASLGKSTGERPFRPLARPLSFLPRSTIRVQVVERSQDTRGTLFLVLHGYKVLGAEGRAEAVVRSLASAAPPRVLETARAADMLPFDYVVSLDLRGIPGAQASEEVGINVDGVFVTTHVGYGLLAESGRPAFRVDERTPRTGGGLVHLRNVSIRSFPETAVIDGLRVRPEYHRIVFSDSGVLAPVPEHLAGEVFESLNRFEDVQFRYTIFDGGRGRPLQDKPLFNIAGLGSADGERPFKRFPKPLVFLPRSTVRVDVEERFGRGTLYFAFQGYKLLRSVPRSVGR